MTHRVAILAYDGLCLFEFGCAVELFALARPELGVPWYQHAVCAVEPGPLRATGGVQVQAPHGLGTLRRANTIIIPGWRNPAEPPPPALLRALQAAHRRGARLASICSGVFVLAHAGLLAGRRATTHWRYADQLAQAFPDITVQAAALYVDEGQVISSAGSAAGLDMLMHLIRRDHGPRIANQVAQRLVMPPHRDGGQAQFVPRPMPDGAVGARGAQGARAAQGTPGSIGAGQRASASAAPDPLAPLLDWLRENLRMPHDVTSMAAQAGLSPRTLQRRFSAGTGLAPQAWLLRERVALAKELLEGHAGLSVDDVAELAGFGSPESLRRHFRLQGLPAPSRYRRQFDLAQ